MPWSWSELEDTPAASFDTFSMAAAVTVAAGALLVDELGASNAGAADDDEAAAATAAAAFCAVSSVFSVLSTVVLKLPQ